MYSHRYTEQEIAWLKKNRKQFAISELAQKFNKKFDCCITKSCLSQAMVRRGIRGDHDGRFLPGHNTWNKGKSVNYLSGTQFKKGSVPARTRPIGSERVEKDGNVFVKVGMPRKWRPKKLIIWEQAFGKIPKGYFIMFLDGNKKNFELSNLACVNRKEFVALNCAEKVQKLPKELFPAVLALVKLEQTAKSLSGGIKSNE